MDLESVVSSIVSRSVMTETTFGDDLTGHESTLILQLTSMHTRRAQTSKNRKQRRKRGASLERQISRYILGTASAGAAAAHFEVGTEPPRPHPVSSAQDILKDLARDQEAWEDFVSLSQTECMPDNSVVTKETVLRESSPLIAVETPLHEFELSQHALYGDPSLDLYLPEMTPEEEPRIREELETFPEELPLLPEQIQTMNFAPIESFESVSWRGSKKVSNTGTEGSRFTDSPDDIRVESVVFKTNFDEWNKFEPNAFLPIGSSEFEYSEHSVGNDSLKARLEESFTVTKTRAQKNDRTPQKMVPDPSPGRHPRIIFDDRSAQSREKLSTPIMDYKKSPAWMEPKNFHPVSPDSIFDYPSAALLPIECHRTVRVDPPASYDLRFPRAEVTQFMI